MRALWEILFAFSSGKEAGLVFHLWYSVVFEWIYSERHSGHLLRRREDLLDENCSWVRSSVFAALFGYEFAARSLSQAVSPQDMEPNARRQPLSPTRRLE
jgi:hypothetical protein